MNFNKKSQGLGRNAIFGIIILLFILGVVAYMIWTQKDQIYTLVDTAFT